MEITEDLLIQEGFQKRIYNGQIMYVKGKMAIVKNDVWLPCNFETGIPLSTCVYVNTMEELYQLIEQTS